MLLHTLSKFTFWNPLAGLPGNALNELQLVQNSPVRLVTGPEVEITLHPFKNSSTSCLLVSVLIFKTFALTFKPLHGLASIYMSQQLTVNEPMPTGTSDTYSI